MRKRITKPTLVRSSNERTNSIIVRKFHKREKKIKPKEDFRSVQQGHLNKPGRTIYIDKSVR